MLVLKNVGKHVWSDTNGAYRICSFLSYRFKAKFCMRKITIIWLFQWR